MMDEDAEAEDNAPKKQVCDPYGLGGKPLDAETVRQQVQLLLNSGWRYEEGSRRLERVFVTCSPSGSQRLKAAKAFRFVQLLGTVCENNAHHAYHLAMKPRSAQVTVQLKTIPLSRFRFSSCVRSPSRLFFSPSQSPFHSFSSLFIFAFP